MKYIVLGAALLLPAHAWAWKTDPVAPVPAPTPAASAVSGSRSSATVSSSQSLRNKVTTDVTITNTVSPSAQGRRGGGSGGGRRVVDRSSGGGGSAGAGPELVAPGIVGGNPCTVGVSLGGIGQNGGGTLGWSWESHECSLRQSAAILANLGLTKASVETLCRTSNDERWALRNAGVYCADDVERWRKEGWRP